ncbi:MAG TPA: hypothetical protein VFO25_05020 [Candidatus Eremiobacteraceae bacterium]|nr:hypothetical protein [Candidatus Eremiobacteraceae bacterium]
MGDEEPVDESPDLDVDADVDASDDFGLAALLSEAPAPVFDSDDLEPDAVESADLLSEGARDDAPP